ncbi:MAG: rRNA pseudouridine synthase [Myxococcales bacterium]|nr:rRNA pseudouridine synthase [Myxococcales bacterium]USN50138.1 MAG: rRNA pseudouridine synthase [Myxococcales bacterium]
MVVERIQKVLARSNVASRRRVEEMILEGRIRLNGKKVCKLGILVDSEKDVVHVNGQAVPLMAEHNQEKIYILLNKPPQVVTTLKDNFNRKTVLHLLPEYKDVRIFPIGRLDYDAQGALLLTNDGELSQKLLHPKYKCKKTYLVKVKGVPKEEDIEKLRRGIYLEDGPTGKSEIEFHRATKHNCWLKVTLTSGKYRQIKRMFFRIENPVMRILRTDFAGIQLSKLEVGKHRQLNKNEIMLLKG